MSSFEDPPHPLGGQDDARAGPPPVSGGGNRLAEHVEAELRITFEIDELLRFFDGFVDLDAQDVYRLACEEPPAVDPRTLRWRSTNSVYHALACHEGER